MRFEYKVNENHKTEICVLRCYGDSEWIEIPSIIDQYQVTEIGDYIFSRGYQSQEEEAAVCGEQVKKVVLPDTVKKIGKYAFYGCRYLEELTIYQGVSNIGGGAFTGCARLHKLHIIMDDNGGYCLKNIVSELSQELEVTLNWKHAKGRILFPEYFEEAVENTPARILKTFYHGSGYSYRQCFQDGNLRFREYDDLFIDAKAWEKADFCIRLALFRLYDPMELSEAAREQYLSYLSEHSREAGEFLIEQDDMQHLEFLSEQLTWQESVIDRLICYAGEQDQMEIVSFLMNYKFTHFLKKKKSFDF